MIINHAPAAAQVNGAVATLQVFPNAVVLPQIPSILSCEGSGVVEMRKFIIRASGRCLTVNNSNVQLTLHAALGATALTIAAPGTVIAQAAAVNQNTTGAPWYIEARLIFDSISGKLHGTFQTMVNNSLSAEAAVAAVLANVSGAAGSAEPALQFTAGISFSIAAATNIGIMNSLEQGDGL